MERLGIIAILLLLLAVPSHQQGCPMDIVLIVDHSGSIQDTSPGDISLNLNWLYIRQYLQALVSRLTIGPSATQVACITFGDNTTVVFGLNQYSTQAPILPILLNLDYMSGGSSNVTGAFRTARTNILQPANGRRSNVPAVCLLVVGFPPAIERDRGTLTPFTDEITQDKTICRIVVVVAGPQDTASYYAAVSSTPSDIFAAANFSVIANYVTPVYNDLASICPTGVPTTTAGPTTAPATTVTTTSVPTIAPGSSTTAGPVPTTSPATTTASAQPVSQSTTNSLPTFSPPPFTLGTTSKLPPCTSCTCSSMADIVFVVDVSGSIDQPNFDQTRAFLINLVTNLQIDSGTLQVGMEIFSDTYHVIFNLNTYKTRQDVIAAISNVTYLRGTTNTADALMNARLNMFTTANGGRSNVNQGVVLITDGGSNDKNATLTQARLLRNTGIHVFVIATGNWVDASEINNTANYPASVNTFYVPVYSNLGSLVSPLVSTLCDNTPPTCDNACMNGGTCQPDSNFFACICTPGFSGQTCNIPCRLPADVIVAVDAASSVGASDFQYQLDFARQVMYGINIGNSARMGMLLYSSTATIQFNLNTYQDPIGLLNGISAYQSGGVTDLGVPIATARDQMFTQANGDQPGVQNVLILITNSQSANATNSIIEASKARAAGITILVVAVNTYINWNEIQGVASYPLSQNIFNVSDFSQLGSIRSGIIASQCNTIDECQSTPCLNGGTCIGLINTYKCVCPATNTGVNCQRSGNGLIDLVIAIDTSGSIRNERFAYIINYITSIMDDLEIGQNKTHVGVVQFADTPQVIFQLNAFTSKHDVQWYTQNIVYNGGRTNTAAALNLIQNTMFTTANGDRSNAPNVAILVTDGNSNINQQGTVPAAIALRIAGAHIVTVSCGTDYNILELQSIASDPTDKTVFTVNSYVGLSTLRDPVLLATTNDIDRCTPNPCQFGGSCFNDYQRYLCTCTPNWSGAMCATKCSNMIDLAFIVDISGSGNFEEVYDVNYEFVNQLAVNLPIASGQVRVAVVTFGSGSNISFYLNTYSTGNDITEALTWSVYMGLGALQDAIQNVYGTVFTTTRGARANVPKVVVIVTDSNSPGDYSAPVAQATTAKQQGITIYAVLVGSGPDPNEFGAIVNNPLTNILTMNTAADVSATVTKLTTMLCS